MKKLYSTVLCYSLMSVISIQNLDAAPQGVGKKPEIAKTGQIKTKKDLITDDLYKMNYELTQIELTAKFANKKIAELEKNQKKVSNEEVDKKDAGKETIDLEVAKAHYAKAFTEAKEMQKESSELVKRIKELEANGAQAQEIAEPKKKFKENCGKVTALERESHRILRILNSM